LPAVARKRRRPIFFFAMLGSVPVESTPPTSPGSRP
jgi:hypothetical protein